MIEYEYDEDGTPNNKEAKKQPDQVKGTKFLTTHTPKGEKPFMQFVKDNHHEDLIIGNMEEGVKLIPAPKKRIVALLSTIEPKTFSEAFNDECWKNATKEELDQFEKNEAWEIIKTSLTLNGST